MGQTNMWFAVLLAATLTSLLAGASEAASAPVVKAPLGKVIGSYCKAGPASFMGIPFAKPPVGSLRWAAPLKFDTKYPANGLNATKPGQRCIQAGDGEMSEDCLYLNVWTPATATSSSKLPVRVYIHGGGYQTGSANDPVMNACQLVKDSDIVTVLMNYRLGVLGYLATPGLTDKGASGTVGNWGLLDQRMALQWVKDNIAAFGGDPQRVVVYGESAGGYSVFMHTVMPKSWGLFSSAVTFSGSPDVMAVDFLKDAYEKGRRFQEALQCDMPNACARGFASQESCLRKADVASILAVQDAFATLGYTAIPTVDGVEIAEHPDVLMAKGKTASVPITMNVNQNEGILEVMGETGGQLDISTDDFTAVMKKLVSVPESLAQRVLTAYNASNYYDSWALAAAAAHTDAAYHCPSYRAALAFSKRVDVRMSVLQAASPNSGCPIYELLQFQLPIEVVVYIMGASHGYDVPLSFLRPAYHACNYSDAEAQLAPFVSGFVATMAAAGHPLPPRHRMPISPQLDALKKWPAWNATDKVILNLDVNDPQLYDAAAWMAEKCQLWDDVMEAQLAAGTLYPDLFLDAPASPPATGSCKKKPPPSPPPKKNPPPSPPPKKNPPPSPPPKKNPPPSPPKKVTRLLRAGKH